MTVVQTDVHFKKIIYALLQTFQAVMKCLNMVSALNFPVAFITSDAYRRNLRKTFGLGNGEGGEASEPRGNPSVAASSRKPNTTERND